jgi:transposase InsO family protein
MKGAFGWITCLLSGWRAVKHEGVYLWAHDNLREMEGALARWFEVYNLWKPHRALEMQTPWQVYRPEQIEPWRVTA